ncbi:helix-turn-helix transcriptional regulator [Pyxidicoccus fallax]|uniref:AraC family transcriptional regulator n=1 Tax=Pyxidicoccus fallax TaxID=394095 RepID=A0A848LEL0_9BACT|nr:helix-turn-helix transcriptional regulator [Pyxidicoccus fallax]NMO16906.1 AraC family transcriptional regulator [Pyxidicoccus fallax]NPC80413.1 helix-turn-helix transcriptional regulator [Pyxidicoccus fallax]
MPSARTIAIIERPDPPELIAIPLRVDARKEPETARHRHARGQLFCVDQGLLVVHTPQGNWVMPPGRAGWIPPGIWHSARWHGPTSGWSVYVAAEACDQLPREARVLRVSRVLEAIIERATGWEPGEPLDATRARLAAVALDELRNADEERTLRLPMPRERRLAAIARALIANPEDGRSLGALAAWAGISERTLTRHFHQETGMTFAHWRQQAKLARALELLSEGQSVADVAFSLGYENVSAFIAMFKRLTGTTPARCMARERRAG